MCIGFACSDSGALHIRIFRILPLLDNQVDKQIRQLWSWVQRQRHKAIQIDSFIRKKKTNVGGLPSWARSSVRQYEVPCFRIPSLNLRKLLHSSSSPIVSKRYLHSHWRSLKKSTQLSHRRKRKISQNVHGIVSRPNWARRIPVYITPNKPMQKRSTAKAQHCKSISIQYIYISKIGNTFRCWFASKTADWKIPSV